MESKEELTPEEINDIRRIAAVIAATGLLPDRRERIAAAALAGLLAGHPVSFEVNDRGELRAGGKSAKAAVEIADALIAELDK